MLLENIPTVPGNIKETNQWKNERKIDLWFKQHQVASVDFSDKQEMFINVNAAEDIEIIEARLRQ